MANRNFNSIKRIMQDFSLGVGEGGTGGVIKVDELPEVGEPYTFYETEEIIPGSYNWCLASKVTKEYYAGWSCGPTVVETEEEDGGFCTYVRTTDTFYVKNGMGQNIELPHYDNKVGCFYDDGSGRSYIICKEVLNGYESSGEIYLNLKLLDDSLFTTNALFYAGDVYELKYLTETSFLNGGVSQRYEIIKDETELPSVDYLLSNNLVNQMEGELCINYLSYKEDNPKEFNYYSVDTSNTNYHWDNERYAWIDNDTDEPVSEIEWETFDDGYVEETITSSGVSLFTPTEDHKGSTGTFIYVNNTWVNVDKIGPSTGQYIDLSKVSSIALDTNKFLAKLVDLGVDIDAEMDMSLYSTKGGIYIGSGMMSYDTREGLGSAETLYLGIDGNEGSGNTQFEFALFTNNYPSASYTTEAMTIEPPLTLVTMVTALGQFPNFTIEPYTFEYNSNTKLYPVIGIKTGSTASDITWYDISLDDMLSFLLIND